jgi:hypothetical protein
MGVVALGQGNKDSGIVEYHKINSAIIDIVSIKT